MVTIVNLIEAYTKKPRNSVWIVPGDLAAFDSEDEECRFDHIDDFLSKRGICLASKVSPKAGAELVNDVTKKFELGNVTVVRETLCND